MASAYPIGARETTESEQRGTITLIAKPKRISRKCLIGWLVLILTIPLFNVGATEANAAVPAGWQPIDTEPMIAEGSALDLSAMNDAPAGKHGFIQIDSDGDYVFEQQPQRKVKLYGGNLSWNMYYGSHEDADRTAERLARLGYNVVRLHSLDSMADWAPGIFQPNSPTPQLNSDRLDQVEYLISRLKAHGIYVVIDLFQLYDFKNVPVLGEYAEGYNSAYLLPTLPEAMEMWKEIASVWLTHVNPYTGIALKDDPVLAGVSPWNESLLLNMRLSSMKAKFRTFLMEDFNDFLADTFGEAPISSISDQYWNESGTIKDRLSAYYSKKTITASNEMRNYLKQELGVEVPVGGLNHIISPNVNYWRNQASDVFETHLYHQFVDKRIDENGKYGFQFRPLKFPRLSMSFDSATNANYPKDWASDRLFGNYYPALSLRQGYETPFLLTEFQDTFPAKGREEAGIFVGATGSFQGWDMLNRYSIGMNVGDAYSNGRLGTPESFSIANDPLAILPEAEGALLFRTGAVQTSEPKFALVWDKTWARDKGAASEVEAYIANMMYIPHLFNTATVYADNPSVPFAVYRITPELTTQQIEAGQFPAVNRIAITSGMTDRQVAEAMIDSLDASPTKTAMLDALDENKLLSDTRELLFDLNLNTYMVRTPTVVAAAGTMDNHDLELGPATVTGDVYKGTFFASSLDEKSLEDSDRLLLIYTTDVAATDEETVQLSTGEVKYFKGKLPTLAKEQTAQFRLSVDRPAGGYKAYKLSLNGVRLEEIPVTVSGSDLVVQLDTDKGFAFELIYDPLFADTFENGNASGWTTVKGQWSVVQDGETTVYRSAAKGKTVIDATYGSDYSVEADIKSTTAKGEVGLLARYADNDHYYVFKYNAQKGKAVIKKRESGMTSVIQSVSGLTTIAAGTPYKLRFETEGTSLIGSVNGQTIITAVDSSIAEGKAGLVSSSKKPVAFDNVLVQHYDRSAPTPPANLTTTVLSSSEINLTWQESTDETDVAGYKVYRNGTDIATVNGSVYNYKDMGLNAVTTYHYAVKAYDPGGRLSDPSIEAIATTSNLLFEDNFEDGVVSDWTVVSNWGNFSVVTDGNSKVYLSDNVDKGGTKSVTGLSTWTDYSIEAKTKVDTWQGRVGLVARFVDYNNFYYMYYASYYKRMFLVKLQNGVETTLATSPILSDPTTGVYHTYRLEVRGNSLKAYLDGQLLASATDSAFGTGKAGVFSHLEKAYFDDVKIQAML
ncbi:fibronectin type III domain-containing protein [Paenibacillus paridis]|uniref:fibronectin type III domain-containing protein n=1 Tax=Paenibacillus paridis TaxID=2583376 RepID=UPI001391AC9E|nr:fibronectin type III domain-containing protein [Paenibacillus paridis]